MLPKWVVWLFTIAGLAVLAAVIFRALTPQPEPIPETPLVTTNIDGSSSIISGVVYSGPEFTPPSVLAEAVVTQQESGETFINQVIERYQLTPDPLIPDLWKGPTYSLSRVAQVNHFILSRNDLEELPIGAIDLDQSVAAARIFVSSNFSSMSVQAIPDRAYYYNEEAPGQPDAAQLLVVPFSYEIDSYPFTYANTSLYPVAVKVDVDYQVQQVTFFPLVVSVQPLQSRRVLSIEEAITNINANKGSVVAAVQENAIPFTLDQITSGQMDSVIIVYKVDETLNIAYPFYQFSGTVTDQEGTVIRALISTPAIATTTQ